MDNGKTAVFGSAFNPPHLGHADVIEQALAVFAQVIIVPSFSHAFGKAMAPFGLRLELVSILLKQHSHWHGRVSVSAIEAEIARAKPDKEPVYTIDVLNALEQRLPQQRLTFVVGPDNAAPEIWAKFYKHNEIERRWGCWVANERIVVRSSEIRAQLSQCQQPAPELCPQAICSAYRRYLDQSNNT